MDEELLRLWAVHGNREAADRLIRAHERALYAFARRMARSEAEAAEIVQETCLRVLQKAALFQGRSSLRTWIFGIAVNVARSRRFRLQRLRELFRPLEASTEPAMNDDASRKSRHEALAQVDAALAALPCESRVPLLLHYYQGFDYQQIGEILDCPPGTVASRLHAARKKLEKSLRRNGGAELAALGSLEALREGGFSPLPAALQQGLRALPQKALAPALAVPVSGSGAAIAGGLAAVALLGSAALLHSEALRVRPIPDWMSAPALRAPASPRPEPASLRRGARLAAGQPLACEERFVAPPRRELLRPEDPSSSATKSAASAGSLALRVSGTLRDADRGAPEACAEIVLRAVWPPREFAAQQDPFVVASSKTDERGDFAMEAEGLAAGVYEVAPLGRAFALPQRVFLRESTAVHGELFLLHAGEDERNALLQSYREGLARDLETLWTEQGNSALALRLFGADGTEPLVFAFRENGRMLDPLARVFQPATGSLLLGPLPAGPARVEILQPGKSSAALADLRVPERGILEASASLVSAEDDFSVEVVDALGLPVAGAHVEIQAAELWAAQPFASGIADHAGRICFEGVPRWISVRACRPAPSGGAATPCMVRCGQAAGGTKLRISLE